MRWLLISLLIFSATSDKWFRVQGGDWVLPEGIEATLKGGVKAEYDREAAVYKDQHGATPMAWSAFSFQYQGVLWEGKRVVVVLGNCPWSIEGEDQTKKLLMFADGADCHFHVYYDPETHTYFHFHFNGSA